MAQTEATGQSVKEEHLLTLFLSSRPSMKKPKFSSRNSGEWYVPISSPSPGPFLRFTYFSLLVVPNLQGKEIKLISKTAFYLDNIFLRIRKTRPFSLINTMLQFSKPYCIVIQIFLLTSSHGNRKKGRPNTRLFLETCQSHSRS